MWSYAGKGGCCATTPPTMSVWKRCCRARRKASSWRSPRATETVTVSAVFSDDVTPSDFMYGYMPEHCPRDIESLEFTTVGSAGEGDEFAGLDADPRGLVAQARVALARYPEDSPQARDAAATLALLARNGIDIAGPDDWPFLDDTASAISRESTASAKQSESTESTERCEPPDGGPEPNREETPCRPP